MLEMYGAELPTWEEDVDQYFTELKLAHKSKEPQKQD